MTRDTAAARAAIEYAERGVPVFPLRPGAKAPLLPTAHPAGDPQAGVCRGGCGRDGHGLWDATIDPGQVRAWWRQHPAANVGLRTGVRFDVLDVDGPEAAAALRDLARRHPGVDLGGGPLVRSARGWHYYLAPSGLGCPPVRGLAGLDWRGQGGAIVAPPSRHPSGRTYRWVRDLTHPLPETPAVLRERLQPPERPTPAAGDRRGERTGLAEHPYARVALDRECDQLARMPADSGRNRALFTASLRLFSLADGGALDRGDVERRLLDAARSSGLDDREASATVRSGQQRIKYPRGIPTPPTSSARPRPRDSHNRGGRAGGRRDRDDPHERTR